MKQKKKIMRTTGKLSCIYLTMVYFVCQKGLSPEQQRDRTNSMQNSQQTSKTSLPPLPKGAGMTSVDGGYDKSERGVVVKTSQRG